MAPLIQIDYKVTETLEHLTCDDIPKIVGRVYKYRNKLSTIILCEKCSLDDAFSDFDYENLIKLKEESDDSSLTTSSIGTKRYV